MTLRYAFAVMTLVAGTAALAAGPGTIEAMKWHRRVLLVSSPRADDPRLAIQRGTFDDWQQGAAERDVSLVTVTDQHVEGASDAASTLRKRYHLGGQGFQALLIGKDGHVAMRSAAPITSDTLRGTIDAMPMRQAGQR